MIFGQNKSTGKLHHKQNYKFHNKKFVKQIIIIYFNSFQIFM